MRAILPNLMLTKATRYTVSYIAIGRHSYTYVCVAAELY